jgi:hypothetical protein
MTRRRNTSVNAPCSYLTYDVIVEPVLERCKRIIEPIVPAPDRPSVASASLAILAQRRHVAWRILQAQMVLEAQQRRSQDCARGCPDATARLCTPGP